MSTTLTCPQGHSWELSEAETALTPAESVCPVCGGPPLTIPPGVISASARSTAPWPSSTPGDPAVAVPGYEILGELGRGGMGVVYRARQEKLKRLVALKMILAGAHAGPEQLARFRSEAEAVARLQHANIVQIYEIGECDGRPFFSLEYVDGGSLAQAIAGTPVPAGPAAALTRTLADAMHYAHERGIVHRDLKPANILLQEEFSQRRKGAKEASQEEGHPQRILESSLAPWRLCENSSFLPKITDFGLAKQLEEESGQTRSGAIMGTPSYMAPEQAEGRTRDIGPPADVYALGAILYELLTGRPPFKGPTVLDTLDQVRHQEPVPPTRLQPAVPRDMELICLTCLRKEPGRRYASAAELAEELRRFLTGEPLLVTRPVSRAERLYRWCKRHPARALAAGLGVLLLAGIAVAPAAYAMLKSRHEQEVGKIESEKQEAERQERYELAENYLDRGLRMCEDGDVAKGLLWLALASESLPEGAADLERVARINLAFWPRQLNTLKQVYPGNLPGGTIRFTPDGRYLTATSRVKGQGWDVGVWEAATGKPVGGTFHLGDEEQPDDGNSLSPDGRRFVTRARIRDAGGTAEFLHLWDTTTGRQLFSQKLADQTLLASAFRPDGHFLLALHSTKVVRFGKKTSTKHLIQLLDAETGQPLGPELPAAAWVHSRFSPDGKHFLTASDTQAQLWDVATGKSLGPALPHPREEIQHTAFNPDGKALLTGTHRWRKVDSKERGEWVVRCWELPAGKPMGEPIVSVVIPFLGNQPLRFSRDGRTFAVATNRATRYFETGTAKPLDGPPKGAFPDASWDPDGKTYARGGKDGVVRVWEAAPGNGPAATLAHGPRGMAYGVVFAADGRTLLTCGAGFDPHLWDTATGQPLALAFQGSGVPLAVSPDSRLALLGDAGGMGGVGPLVGGWLCDLGTGARHGERLSFAPHALTAAAFRPDGGAILTGTDGAPNPGGEARLWDATGRPLSPPVIFPQGVSKIAFSPDGRIALVALDSLVVLLDGSTGQMLGEALRQPGRVQALAFGDDGRTFVVSNYSGVTQFYDTATRLPAGEPFPHAAALSPDGRWAAAQDRLWELPAWKPLGRQPVREAGNGLFTPDGRVFLSGTASRAWDSATGKPLGPPFAHHGPLSMARVSPDGQTIVTAGGPNAYLWHLPPPLAGAPDRVRLWVEVISGSELDVEKKVINALPAAAWQERKRRLDELGGPPG